MFFIILDLIFINFFMILIKLIERVIQNICQWNIWWVVKIDSHILFWEFTTELKEEEVIENSHYEVESVSFTRNESVEWFLEFMKLLQIVLNVTLIRNKSTRRVVENTHLKSLKVIMSEQWINLVSFKGLEIIAVD